MEGRGLRNKTMDGEGSWVPAHRPCRGGGRDWGVEGAGGLVWGLEAVFGVILGLGAGLGVMDAQLKPCGPVAISPLPPPIPGGSGRCLCCSIPVPTWQHPEHLLPGPGPRDFGDLGVLQCSQPGEGGLCILCQLMHHHHGNTLDAAPSLWISLDIWGVARGLHGLSPLNPRDRERQGRTGKDREGQEDSPWGWQGRWHSWICLWVTSQPGPCCVFRACDPFRCSPSHSALFMQSSGALCHPSPTSLGSVGSHSWG